MLFQEFSCICFKQIPETISGDQSIVAGAADCPSDKFDRVAAQCWPADVSQRPTLELGSIEHLPSVFSDTGGMYGDCV